MAKMRHAAVRRTSADADGKALKVGVAARESRTVRGIQQVVRMEKVAVHVARQIVRDIKSQGLKPDDRLPVEATMLERFDIARASLREAMRILEVNGLVRVNPRRGGGLVVGESDPDTFGGIWTLHIRSIGGTYRDLMEAWVELESTMARQAAESHDAAAVPLLFIADKGRRSTADDDDEYVDISVGFHSALSRVSGNAVLALIANSIQSVWTRHVGNFLYTSCERSQVHQQHREIADAVRARDGVVAERLMRRHMLRYLEYSEARYAERMDEIVDWN